MIKILILNSSQQTTWSLYVIHDDEYKFFEYKTLGNLIDIFVKKISKIFLIDMSLWTTGLIVSTVIFLLQR